MPLAGPPPEEKGNKRSEFKNYWQLVRAHTPRVTGRGYTHCKGWGRPMLILARLAPGPHRHGQQQPANAS